MTDLASFALALTAMLIAVALIVYAIVGALAVRYWMLSRRDRRVLSPLVPLEAVRPVSELERARARRDARGPRSAA